MAMYLKDRCSSVVLKAEFLESCAKEIMRSYEILPQKKDYRMASSLGEETGSLMEQIIEFIES